MRAEMAAEMLTWTAPVKMKKKKKKKKGVFHLLYFLLLEEMRFLDPLQILAVYL